MIPPTAATAANSALWTARSRVIKVCGPPPRNSSNDTAPHAASAAIFSMLDGCASAWRAKSTMLFSPACAAADTTGQGETRMRGSKVWGLSSCLMLGVLMLAVPAEAQQTKTIRFVLDWAFQGQQGAFTLPASDGTFARSGLNVVIDRGVG